MARVRSHTTHCPHNKKIAAHSNRRSRRLVHRTRLLRPPQRRHPAEPKPSSSPHARVRLVRSKRDLEQATCATSGGSCKKRHDNTDTQRSGNADPPTTSQGLHVRERVNDCMPRCVEFLSFAPKDCRFAHDIGGVGDPARNGLIISQTRTYTHTRLS